MGKVIYWKLCKKFKFNHANKWYMHKLEPVLENETHKLLWDFEIQTDYLISASRPYNQQKKRACQIAVFAVSADHRIKLKESEKKEKYLDFTRELKKLWYMKVTVIPIVIGALGTVTKGLVKGLGNKRKTGKGTGGLGNKRKSGNHANYCIIKISQIPEKNPGELRKLAVTQTTVKSHKITPMWKTFKRLK